MVRSNGAQRLSTACSVSCRVKTSGPNPSSAVSALTRTPFASKRKLPVSDRSSTSSLSGDADWSQPRTIQTEAFSDGLSKTSFVSCRNIVNYRSRRKHFFAYKNELLTVRLCVRPETGGFPDQVKLNATHQIRRNLTFDTWINGSMSGWTVRGSLQKQQLIC